MKFLAEENFLLSNEQIRSSPELWPEKIAGSDAFLKGAVKNAKENEKGITQDDIRRIYRKSIIIHIVFISKSTILEIGSLPKTEIVAEIRRLYDEAYQLGLEESKEVTRGKYLNVFTSNAPFIKRPKPS